MEANQAEWKTLFESHTFFDAYKNYLQIDIVVGDEDDLREWKGGVESRLRKLTLKLEMHTFGMLQSHPHPGDFSDKTRHFHSCFFMGLQRKSKGSVNEAKQFDIRVTVAEFKSIVNSYTSRKFGMEIQVSHIKCKDIPLFVFPGGVRPPRPPRVPGTEKCATVPTSNGFALCNKESEECTIGTSDMVIDGREKCSTVSTSNGSILCNKESKGCTIGTSDTMIESRKRKLAEGTTNDATETKYLQKPTESLVSYFGGFPTSTSTARKKPMIKLNLSSMVKSTGICA